jgi:SnoaL-like domain
MSNDEKALATLIAKDEIRELAQLYSRGVDRQDFALLRTLYTRDATDSHGFFFDGTAADYVDKLEQSLPLLRYSGHHICNHLISVDGDEAEGEVYALAYHTVPDGKGGFAEDLQGVRYIDRYRKEKGRWLFAQRVVNFDFRTIRPVPTPKGPAPVHAKDPSYATLMSRLFARGPRA